MDHPNVLFGAILVFAAAIGLLLGSAGASPARAFPSWATGVLVVASVVSVVVIAWLSGWRMALSCVAAGVVLALVVAFSRRVRWWVQVLILGGIGCVEGALILVSGDYRTGASVFGGLAFFLVAVWVVRRRQNRDAGLE